MTSSAFTPSRSTELTLTGAQASKKGHTDFALRSVDRKIDAMGDFPPWRKIERLLDVELSVLDRMIPSPEGRGRRETDTDLMMWEREEEGRIKVFVCVPRLFGARVRLGKFAASLKITLNLSDSPTSNEFPQADLLSLLINLSSSF